MRDRTRIQIAETKIGCVVHQATVLKSKRGVPCHRDREVGSSAINEGTHSLSLRAQYTPAIISRVKYQGSALCKNIGAHPQFVIESARHGQVEYQASGRLVYVGLDPAKAYWRRKQLTVAIPTISYLGAHPERLMWYR